MLRVSEGFWWMFCLFLICFLLCGLNAANGTFLYTASIQYKWETLRNLCKPIF